MIGILGGTFDPIHLGHLKIALELEQKLPISKLRLIPCYQPVHKPSLNTAINDRLNMLRLAIASHPTLSIDEREIKSQKACYTIDTLKQIREELGDKESIVFILGMDAFNHFDSWKDYQQILHYAHLIVVNRPNTNPQLSSSLQYLLQNHQSLNLDELNEKPAGLIYFYSIDALAFSATEVREQAASTGIKAVDQYIDIHHLYNNPTYRKPMILTEFTALIKNTLDEAKALNITEIDVKDMTDVCDYLFICTATSGRHARSIDNKLIETIKQENLKILGTEETEDDSWILVDLGRCVIHIMLEETRTFYNLEQLWDLTTNSREKHAN